MDVFNSKIRCYLKSEGRITLCPLRKSPDLLGERRAIQHFNKIFLTMRKKLSTLALLGALFFGTIFTSCKDEEDLTTLPASINVELVETAEEITANDGPKNDIGRLTIKFTVEAVNGDVYIPQEIKTTLLCTAFRWK